MGTKGLRGRLEVADEALLFYAGFSPNTPLRQCLGRAPEGLFRVPVQVAQFIGQWLPLSEVSRSDWVG
jgi:predicted component of type VI protein secretion system